MENCKFDKGDYCDRLSGGEVKQPCVEGPCMEFESDTNAPLTLDELRCMDGEPVYVLGLAVWVLVNMDTGVPVFVFRDGGRVTASDCYEVDYISYRRPPEKGA